jgi:hypothetical protein
VFKGSLRRLRLRVQLAAHSETEQSSVGTQLCKGYGESMDSWKAFQFFAETLSAFFQTSLFLISRFTIVRSFLMHATMATLDSLPLALRR